MSAILDLILGPLGAALGGLAAIVVAFLAGRSNARQKAAGEAAKGYADERRKIDAIDVGLDLDDSGRIERLRDIAARARQRKD